MDKNFVTGPILPLRDLVVFPSITSPLFVGRSKSIDAINHAMNSNDKARSAFLLPNLITPYTYCREGIRNL